MATEHTKPCRLFDRFLFVAHIYEVPTLRKITLCTMSFLICNLLLSVLYFIMHWDLHLIVKNGFVIIIVTFDLVITNEVFLSLPRHFDFLRLKDQMWPLTEAGPEVSRQIQNDIWYLKISRVLITLFLVMSGLICVPISGDIRELFCILYLLEDIEQKFWYPYLVYFTFFIKFLFVISLPNPVYMLLVVVGDATYAMMILREKIRSIVEAFGMNDELYEDVEYNRFVRRVLTRAIQEHLTIKRYQEVSTEVMKRNFFIIFIVCVLSVALFYFNVKMNMSTGVLMKSSFIIFVSIIFAYLFTRIGQQLKNESEELFRDLCNCPWFLWNKSNKMIYLMFLTHTKEPIVVRSLGYELEYSLLIRVMRTAWSILTALLKLTS